MTYLNTNSCVLVLAGGRGSRSLDPKLPKILQRVESGRSLLQYHLNCFASANIPLVYLLVAHGACEVKNEVELLKAKLPRTMQIEFIPDPNWVHGTTDVILNAFSLIPEVDDITIFLGDEMFIGDLRFLYKRWISTNKEIGIVAHMTNHPLDSDTILVNNHAEITTFIPKNSISRFEEIVSNLSASGIIFLKRTALENLKSISGDITRDLIEANIDSRKVAAIQTTDYLKDTGTPERLAEVRKTISLKIQKRLLNGVPAIFVDRDGTLIPDIGDSRKAILESDISKEIALEIKAINHSSIPIFMVTNQPGIAKGFLEHFDVNRVHDQISKTLLRFGAFLDGYIYCPHHTSSGFNGEKRWLKLSCECRKPNPGMLRFLAEKFRLDLKNSFLIGDSTNDELAARNAGCNFIMASLENRGPTVVAQALSIARTRIVEFDNN